MTRIDEDAFDAEIAILAHADTAAEAYAKDNQLQFVLLP